MQRESLSESKYCVFTLLGGAPIAPYVCAPPAPGPGHTHTCTHAHAVTKFVIFCLPCWLQANSKSRICYLCVVTVTVPRTQAFATWHWIPQVFCVNECRTQGTVHSVWLLWHPVPWSDPGTPSHQQLSGPRLGTHCKGHGKESCQKAADFVELPMGTGSKWRQKRQKSKFLFLHFISSISRLLVSLSESKWEKPITTLPLATRFLPGERNADSQKSGFLHFLGAFYFSSFCTDLLLSFSIPIEEFSPPNYSLTHFYRWPLSSMACGLLAISLMLYN